MMIKKMLGMQNRVRGMAQQMGQPQGMGIQGGPMGPGMAPGIPSMMPIMKPGGPPSGPIDLGGMGAMAGGMGMAQPRIGGGMGAMAGGGMREALMQMMAQKYGGGQGQGGL